MDDLENLTAAPYNPRTISVRDYESLKKSIKDLGDLSGLVFNRRTNTIVGGHQRKQAYAELGGDIVIEQELPEANSVGTVARGYVLIGDERYTYRVVDWDESKERFANLAANKISGEWDDDALAELMVNVKDEPWLLDAGFDEEELAGILNSVMGVEGADPDAEVEESNEPVKTQKGQMFALGRHKLLCGDSTSEPDVARLMGGGMADLVFTDPPYMVDYQSPAGMTYKSKKFGGDGGKIFNDNLDDAAAVEFYTKVLENLYKFSKDSSAIYWWHAMKNHLINEIAFKATGWYSSQTIIWVKESMVFAIGQDFHRMYEPVLFGWKKGKKHYANKKIANLKDVFTLSDGDFVDQMDVWLEKRDSTSDYVHPTQKPIALAIRAFRKHTKPKDLVLDLFGGSGSTLIAAESFDRSAYLMELDPKYCDAIIKRWEAFTGLKAELINETEGVISDAE